MKPRPSMSVALATAGLAGLMLAVPATSAAAAPAAGGPGGVVVPPGGGGPATYEDVVNGYVHLSGAVSGQGFNATYSPPPCWMTPKFTTKQSYVQGDPSGSESDADSTWFFMADQYPGIIGLVNHDPGARGAINQDFQEVQNGKNDNGGGPVSTPPDMWWVPSWLNGPQGLACVLGLNMNNGLVDLDPVGTGAAAAAITPLDLAQLARAALQLPTVTLHTNPNAAAGHDSYTNLPTWVWATLAPARNYGGNAGTAASPQDRAEVPWLAGNLWANVTAKLGSINLTTSENGAVVYDGGCHQTSDSAALAYVGTPYTGQTGTPTCGIKFTRPSTGYPDGYTVTMTLNWTVTYVDSAGGNGALNNPPAQAVKTINVKVAEVQALNGSSPANG